MLKIYKLSILCIGLMLICNLSACKKDDPATTSTTREFTKFKVKSVELVAIPYPMRSYVMSVLDAQGNPLATLPDLGTVQESSLPIKRSVTTSEISNLNLLSTKLTFSSLNAGGGSNSTVSDSPARFKPAASSAATATTIMQMSIGSNVVKLELEWLP